MHIFRKKGQLLLYMKEIIGLLNEKLAFLAKEARAAEKSLANAPKEGRIKVSASSSWVKAYLITKETGPGSPWNIRENLLKMIFLITLYPDFTILNRTNRHPFDIRLFEKQIRISGLF